MYIYIYIYTYTHTHTQYIYIYIYIGCHICMYVNMILDLSSIPPHYMCASDTKSEGILHVLLVNKFIYI